MNEIQEVLQALAGLFLVFLPVVSVNVEYFTQSFNVEGKNAKLMSSAFGVFFAALAALYYWMPETAPYIATFLFLDLAWVGPSGGHDLIAKFAGKVGNGS